MSENFAMVLAPPLCGTRLDHRVAHDRVDAADCVVMGIGRFEIAAEREFMMKRSREPVMVERLRPPLHHLFPDSHGTAYIDGVGVEALGAVLKMIDLAVFDPHEIRILVDEKTDIAIPEARRQEKFRVPVQTIPNGVDRQHKPDLAFSIHGLPSVMIWLITMEAWRGAP